jgi:lysophospholipase L1-like esterase
MKFRTLFTRWNALGRGAFVSAVLLFGLGSDYVLASYPLTDLERERLSQYIPHTFAKLEKRDPDVPVHIVAIGDSVTRYVSYDGHEEDSHRAYHGVFAAELAREFFYTGGVRDVEPSKGNPEKANISQGPEITLQNLGMSGRTAMHALSRLTTDAFVYGTDLVLINFGINDCNGGTPLPTFDRALRRSVAILKERGVDVILIGSSVIRDSPVFAGTARTMIYADAVRTVAEDTGVFFVDLADVTAGGAGIDPAAAPEGIKEGIFADMGRNFDHGVDADGKAIFDSLHPSEAGHRVMGQWIFNSLMKGKPQPEYKFSEARVTLGESGVATIDIRLKNLSTRDQSGFLFALPNLSNLSLSETDFPFELGSRKELAVRIECKTVDSSGGFLFPGHEGFLRLPFFVADRGATVPMVAVVPVMPLNVIWAFGQQDEVKDTFTIEPSIMNYGATALSGTYEGAWAGQKVTGSWNAPAGASAPITLAFRPPGRGDSVRLRDDLRLTVKMADGVAFQFKRGLEATRNLAIGETVKLARSDLYLTGGNDGTEGTMGEVTLVPMADQSGLYLTFRISGLDLKDTALNPAVAIDVHIDARKSKEKRPFGYTDFIRLQLRMNSPDVKIGGLRPAVFGDGYDLLLDSDNLAVSREVLAGGGMQVVLKIPRSYLYHHEWALGNGNSIIGISSRVNILEVTAEHPDGDAPASRRFVLNEPGESPHSTDSLVALELDPEPTGRWSVRLY